MATKKISELPVATALAGTELIEVVQAAASKQATVAEIVARAVKYHQLSCSDLITELTAASNVGYFRSPIAFTLTGIRASLLQASDTGVVTIDVNVNGSTILSTKLTIDQGELTSVTAVAPPVITNTTIASDDLITIDIDDPGANARGLILTFLGV